MTELDKCQQCGGPADNGHDREYPPNPYVCTRCSALWAAASDLLEACKNLENDDGSIPEHAWRLVQDAIAKAEGDEEPGDD